MKSRVSRALEQLPVWASAAGLLFTAAAYGWFQRTRTPWLGMDAPWLVAIFKLEFLVVHSFPFLMTIALQRPRWPQWHGVRALAFGLFLLLYLAGAHGVGGWRGVGLFASLAAVTYLGFFVHLDEGIDKLPELALRWVCNIAFYIAVIKAFRMPSEVSTWDLDHGVLRAGGLYFLGLAVLELSGLYRHPFLPGTGRRIRAHFVPSKRAPVRTPEAPPTHGFAYWAIVPILASALVNLGPLLLAGYVAGAGARFIDERFEWPQNTVIQQVWFPATMVLILLPVRCWQFRRILEGRRRSIALSILISLYLMVGVLRYQADPTYHFAYRSLPAEAYTGFLLLEVPLLFFLLPATWLMVAFPRRPRPIARRTSRRKSAESPPQPVGRT